MCMYIYAYDKIYVNFVCANSPEMNFSVDKHEFNIADCSIFYMVHTN